MSAVPAMLGAVAAVTVQTHIRNQQQNDEAPTVSAPQKPAYAPYNGVEAVFGLGRRTQIVLSTLVIAATVATVVIAGFHFFG